MAISLKNWRSVWATHFACYYCRYPLWRYAAAQRRWSKDGVALLRLVIFLVCVNALQSQPIGRDWKILEVFVCILGTQIDLNGVVIGWKEKFEYHSLEIEAKIGSRYQRTEPEGGQSWLPWLKYYVQIQLTAAYVCGLMKKFSVPFCIRRTKTFVER